MPIPLLGKTSLDFSFSGLKTAARLLIEKEQGHDADIAASFEHALIETLVAKSLRALEQTGLHELVISGGVSANQRLRTRLTEETLKIGASVFYPRLEFCTDNGAMIALVGALKFASAKTDALEIEVKARAPI